MGLTDSSYMLKFFSMLCGAVAILGQAAGQTTATSPFTSADTLRGSLNANRTWWDVRRYDVTITPNFSEKTISGHTKITFESFGGALMQIDLQQPLVVDSVKLEQKLVPFERQNNLLLVQVNGNGASAKLGSGRFSITVYYHGQPKIAQRPPWDGGWIFATDKLGRPWMTVACQGLGASVWYPCKDHQSDEPNDGASLTVTVPEALTVVANGKLIDKRTHQGLTTSRWEVRNPINAYNLVPYIGKYENFSEQYAGEEGPLTCNYWVLDYNVEKAKQQFAQAKSMLQCFENWFGPYPFYEDGYQLVEAPHLGMEHQSAIAYGNNFLNGYRGRDLSGTGIGTKWDYILVHESGHEWFGNNITTNDIADMWVHESFTTYSEVLYSECAFGKTAGSNYVRGIRRNIRNDKPIIGPYGVNKEGSGDMYHKGANMIHTLRTSLNNDSLFRSLLRQMNQQFYHSTISGRQVEQFWSAKTGADYSALFEQYLRTTQIPVVEWRLQNETVEARLSNCVKGFWLNLWMPTAEGTGVWRKVTDSKWTAQATTLSESTLEDLWRKDYYVDYRAIAPPALR